MPNVRCTSLLRSKIWTKPSAIALASISIVLVSCKANVTVDRAVDSTGSSTKTVASSTATTTSTDVSEFNLSDLGFTIEQSAISRQMTISWDGNRFPEQARKLVIERSSASDCMAYSQLAEVAIADREYFDTDLPACDIVKYRFSINGSEKVIPAVEQIVPEKRMIQKSVLHAVGMDAWRGRRYVFKDQYVFVTGGDAGNSHRVKVHSFDLSDLSNPNYLGKSASGVCAWLGYIAIQGDYLYHSGWTKGLNAFNISNPSSITVSQDNCGVGAVVGASVFKLTSTHLIGTSDNGKIHSALLSNLASSGNWHVVNLPSGSGYASIEIMRSDIALVKDETGSRLLSYNISNPSSITLQNSIATDRSENGWNDIVPTAASHGDYFATANKYSNSIQIFRLDSSSVVPTMVSRISAFTSVNTITMNDRYLIAGGVNQVRAYDIIDPENPKLIHTIDLPEYVIGVTIQDNVVIVPQPFISKAIVYAIE